MHIERGNITFFVKEVPKNFSLILYVIDSIIYDSSRVRIYLCIHCDGA